MSKFWTNAVNNLEPYVPGEQPQDQQYIKLNTNENPYSPSPKALAVIAQQATESLRLYPDPSAKVLTQTIADYYALNADNIFVGNGSDEVLALAFYCFFEKEQPLYYPDLSYSFYPVYCDFYALQRRPLAVDENFKIDLNDYLDDGSSGVIFPNPNAPTGRYLELDKIKHFLDQYQNKVVIVDEAYIDFGGESAVKLINDYANLLVVQTFSKSRSLAGMRVGFAMGHTDLINGLERAKNSFNSYPLDKLAQVSAVEALKDQTYFELQRDKIIASRRWTTEQLELLGFSVVPSKANFVLASPKDNNGEGLYLALKAKGILVRYFSANRIQSYCRITIGTQAEMEKMIAVIKTL
jgi:histidinol-phosphate aminotransferase